MRLASSFRADFATRGAAISFFTRASVVLFDSFLGVFFLMYARCHQLQNNNVQLRTLPTMWLNSTGRDAQTQFVGTQPLLPVHLSSPLLTTHVRRFARRPNLFRDARPEISSACSNSPRAAIWFPSDSRACNDGTRPRAGSCPARIICRFPGR